MSQGTHEPSFCNKDIISILTARNVSSPCLIVMPRMQLTMYEVRIWGWRWMQRNLHHEAL
jgi:hypothetical protein